MIDSEVTHTERSRMGGLKGQNHCKELETLQKQENFQASQK
jgi:hypothetical protein